MRELTKAVILQCWWESMCVAQMLQHLLHENFSRMKFEAAWNA